MGENDGMGHEARHEPGKARQGRAEEWRQPEKGQAAGRAAW